MEKSWFDAHKEFFKKIPSSSPRTYSRIHKCLSHQVFFRLPFLKHPVCGYPYIKYLGSNVWVYRECTLFISARSSGTSFIEYSFRF